jgi:hypothetical protein
MIASSSVAYLFETQAASLLIVMGGRLRTHILPSC